MYYSWYKNSREIIKSYDMERNRIIFKEMTQQYFDDYIGNQKHYKGNLDLYGLNLTSLGKLETVSGWIDLSWSKITSLGNLKGVSGGLNLRDSKITSLGNLEYMEGSYIHCDEGSTIHKLLMDSKFKEKVWA